MKNWYIVSLLFVLSFGCGDVPALPPDAGTTIATDAPKEEPLELGDTCRFTDTLGSCPDTGWCFSDTEEDKCDDGTCTKWQPIGLTCNATDKLCDYKQAVCSPVNSKCVSLRKKNQTCDIAKGQICDSSVGRCDPISRKCIDWLGVGKLCRPQECNFNKKLYCAANRCTKKKDIGAVCTPIPSTERSLSCKTGVCKKGTCAPLETALECR